MDQCSIFCCRIFRYIMLYVFLRSYTNVSNLKRPKMIEISANKPHTYILSTISSSAIKKDEQEMNLSMDSAIIESTKSLTPKIASQLSNVADEISIQPSANFLTPFKKISCPGFRHWSCFVINDITQKWSFKFNSRSTQAFSGCSF